MAVSLSGEAEPCDIVVVGAGLAGLAAAIGFAEAGFSVVACGATERLGQGRTVALLAHSIDFLRDLRVWDDIQPLAAPFRSLRIVDDSGSLFAPRPIEFHADEIGLDAFGWNVENALFAEALATAAAAQPNLRRFESQAASFAFAPERAGVVLADGRRFEARLVVGADGRASAARKAAGIATSAHPYPQSALTALLSHARPHDDYSTEFHTRQGPFALVPLSPTSGARFRSSLVWVMSRDEAARRAALDDETLAGEIERQARSMLGAMRLEGERGVFPLARQSVARLAAARLALVGDAAHALPPIGAQGLNLGLRDVEVLIEEARSATTAGEDIGGEPALARYCAARGPDVATRLAAVDALNRSLIADFAPIDAARGLGLAALGAIGPLRRLVMREGVAAKPRCL